MKKIILVTMAFLIFFDTFLTPVSANTNYNHSELMEYEGYGEAMYESIVEQTTYITGQYSENKDYVSQSIDKIVDYANHWKNEYNEWDQTCSGMSSWKNCLVDGIEKGGGYALTVADWFKSLFKGYGDENETTINDFVNNGIYTFSNGRYSMISPFVVDLSSLGGHSGLSSVHWTFSTRAGSGIDYMHDTNPGSFMKTVWYGSISQANEKRDEMYDIRDTGNLISIINAINAETGGSITIRNGTTREPIDTGVVVNPDYSRTYNYITENSLPTVPVPQIKPQLVCPDGTKISMNISGSTFLGVDGTVMIVEKDGTAQVNGQLCNLNWLKPTVEYNPDGQPVVTNPDGSTQNLDTGDSTNKPPGSTDLEGCNGLVMCALGKVLDGVGSIVGAIGDLVLKLLKGLKDLFIELFVPDADFFAPLLTEMRTLAVEKLKMDEMKKLFDGISGGGEAVAVNEEMGRGGVSVMSARSGGDMFAINPDDIVNTSFIDEMLPTVHSWVRGFFYPLLIYFNINQLYKMIRGTSLFGGRGKDD